MIGEIRQSFTEASASAGVIVATALHLYAQLVTQQIFVLQVVAQCCPKYKLSILSLVSQTAIRHIVWLVDSPVQKTQERCWVRAPTSGSSFLRCGTFQDFGHQYLVKDTTFFWEIDKGDMWKENWSARKGHRYRRVTVRFSVVNKSKEGRIKVWRWNEHSALQVMCDAE